MNKKTPPHYSPAVQHGAVVYTSGQLPLIDVVHKTAAEGIKAQTVLALEKVEKVLSEYGLDRNDVLKTTAFITHIDDWAVVNQVYADFFGDHKPARSIIPCGALHYGCLIEIEAIAAQKING